MLVFRYIWFQLQLWYRAAFFVNPLAKLRCPACGEAQPEVAPRYNPNKRRHLQFFPPYEAIIATCWSDKAKWAIPLVVPYSGWKVKGIEELMLEAQAQEDEKIASRENDKLGIKR